MGSISAVGVFFTIRAATRASPLSRNAFACTVLSRSQRPRPSVPAFRSYATSNGLGGTKTSIRKQVTVRNDDGRVQWNDLTTGEKAARTTQQTFNFGVVFAGFIGTV